jgi:hypothetical protein
MNMFRVPGEKTFQRFGGLIKALAKNGLSEEAVG